MDTGGIDLTGMGGMGTGDTHTAGMHTRPRVRAIIGAGPITHSHIATSACTTGTLPGITPRGAITTRTMGMVGATTTVGVTTRVGATTTVGDITMAGDGAGGIGTEAG
jgi:hypothetical protein